MMTMPTKKAVKKPVAAMRCASCVSPAPSTRDMWLPDPWPNMNPTACMMAINGKTTPTAPDMLADWINPTKYVSAML